MDSRFQFPDHGSRFSSIDLAIPLSCGGIIYETGIESGNKKAPTCEIFLSLAKNLSRFWSRMTERRYSSRLCIRCLLSGCGRRCTWRLRTVRAAACKRRHTESGKCPKITGHGHLRLKTLVRSTWPTFSNCNARRSQPQCPFEIKIVYD